MAMPEEMQKKLEALRASLDNRANRELLDFLVEYQELQDRRIQLANDRALQCMLKLGISDGDRRIA